MFSSQVIKETSRSQLIKDYRRLKKHEDLLKFLLRPLRIAIDRAREENDTFGLVDAGILYLKNQVRMNRCLALKKVIVAELDAREEKACSAKD